MDSINTCSVYKALYKLGTTAIVAALLDEINSVIDTIFMGHFIGAEAVAAMSIVLPFLIFSSAFSLLFGDGAAISMGRYLGAKDYEKSSIIASLTLKMTLTTSICLGLVSFMFMPKLLFIFNLDKTTYIYALKYIRYFSLGLPFFMYSILTIKILYTEGRTKQTLKYTLVQVALNIVFNAILLGIFGLGVEGAVVGTLLSMLIQSILVTRYMNKSGIKSKFKKHSFNKSYFKEVIPLGMPAFLTMILLAVTMAVQSKVIAGYGSDALGVETIFGNLFSISSSISTGVFEAALVLMAYSVGSKNKARFMEVLKKTILIVLITSMIINLPIVYFPDIIGRIFTNSSNILRLMIVPIIILGVTSPFIFTTNTFLFAMQPIGMERTATIVFALQQIVLFLPLIYFLKNISFIHAMAAQPVAEVIGGIITLLLIPKLLKAVNKHFEINKSNVINLND